MVRTPLLAPAVLALVTFLPTAGRAQPPLYRLIILPGTYEANGVNNLGEVVGRTTSYEDPGQPFYYHAGQMITFGNSGYYAGAWAISDSGWIAGIDEVDEIAYAMRADRTGNFSSYSGPNVIWGEAYGVNNDGVIVGWVETEDGYNHAASWTNGQFGDMSGSDDWNGAFAINSEGVAVGWTGGPPYKAATFDPQPAAISGAPGTNSQARGNCDSVFIAGTGFNGAQSWVAWAYDGHSFAQIASGPPDGTTQCYDVNNRGQFVGTNNGQAFLYQDGQYYDLNSLVADGFGNLVEARAINDCGVIVGVADQGGFLLVPIDSLVATDSDEDGLLDAWEECGCDLDVDGVRELVLPDADPLHKDIYLEIDHTASAPVNPQAVTELVNAFAGGDVINPDGSGGVTLHVLVDDGDVPDSGDLELQNGADPFPPEFGPIKQTKFGTAEERGDADAERILLAKRRAYHYCVSVAGLLWNDGATVKHPSGIGECPGNDLMIAGGTLGTWQKQAGTLMHELGHNLGLQHGGGDLVNYKANYFSVMNYLWQQPINPYSGYWKLDYSKSASNPSLNESALDENTGLLGITRNGERVVVPLALDGDPTTLAFPQTNFGPINFDSFAEFGVVNVDLNHIYASDPATPGEVHNDHDDWGSLELAFQNTPSFDEGVRSFCPGAGDIEFTQEFADYVEAQAPATAVAPPPAVAIGLSASPNPFGAECRIRFIAGTAGERVHVAVFDPSGRIVATLLDGPRPAGLVELSWDGRDDVGRPVSAGVYVVRATTGERRETIRVVRTR